MTALTDTLIDTHCHLTTPDLRARLADVRQAAQAAGVARMILVATDVADAHEALKLLGDYPEFSLVLGVHPHSAGRCDKTDLAQLAALFKGEGAARGLADRLVGVGETGLDFHYDFAPRPQQERVFYAHLELAQQLDRPIVIHARESEDRVCDILSDFPTLAGRVVFHCFSGDTDLARRVLDLGHYVSFTGVVTFRKSETIQATARYVPADRMMVETDAPYLSPEPVRKVRPCEPALVVHTARYLADLRRVPFATLAATTTANARRFFRLPEEAV